MGIAARTECKIVELVNFAVASTCCQDWVSGNVNRPARQAQYATLVRDQGDLRWRLVRTPAPLLVIDQARDPLSDAPVPTTRECSEMVDNVRPRRNVNGIQAASELRAWACFRDGRKRHVILILFRGC